MYSRKAVLMRGHPTPRHGRTFPLDRHFRLLQKNFVPWCFQAALFRTSAQDLGPEMAPWDAAVANEKPKDLLRNNVAGHSGDNTIFQSALGRRTPAGPEAVAPGPRSHPDDCNGGLTSISRLGCGPPRRAVRSRAPEPRPSLRPECPGRSLPPWSGLDEEPGGEHDRDAGDDPGHGQG